MAGNRQVKSGNSFTPRAHEEGRKLRVPMCFALFIGDHLARSVRGLPGAPPANDEMTARLARQ
jgi:hypothetical protein